MTTSATATPIIMFKDGDDDDDDDDWLVEPRCVLVMQSSEANESSIAGQSGSTSRVTPFTFNDGLLCTQLFITVTISSAAVVEAGTCKIIIARYTTVLLSSPLDPRQLKVSSTILLDVKSHEQRSATSCVKSDLMSICFCILSFSYMHDTHVYIIL